MKGFGRQIKTTNEWPGDTLLSKLNANYDMDDNYNSRATSSLEVDLEIPVHIQPSGFLLL